MAVKCAAGNSGTGRARVIVAGAALAALSVSPTSLGGPEVDRGHTAYRQHCAPCHGSDLEGGVRAPPLQGAAFGERWNGMPRDALVAYLRSEMPPQAPDSLPAQDYADIAAYLLARDGTVAQGVGAAPGREGGPQRARNERATRRALERAQWGPVRLGALYGTLRSPSTRGPTQAELDAADADTASWLMYNKGYRAERYSLLQRIDTGNAGQLRPLCTFLTTMRLVVICT